MSATKVCKNMPNDRLIRNLNIATSWPVRILGPWRSSGLVIAAVDMGDI